MPLPRLQIVCAATAALALSACVVAPYPHHRVVDSAPPVYSAPVDDDAPLAVVEMAPPASQVEVIPVMPFPGALWINGYWGWSGGRHVWMGGHWAHPRAGFTWQPHVWVQLGGRWNLRGGGWRRHR